MVFTHLPANLLPDRGRPDAERRARRSPACSPGAPLSQMDVPARTSYVMAIVRPEERAAAASVTNVPRSLAAAAAAPSRPAGCCSRSTLRVAALIARRAQDRLRPGAPRLFHDVRPPEELALVPAAQ